MNISTMLSTRKLLPVVMAIVIIVGGGAFYGGIKYAEDTPSTGLEQGDYAVQFSRENFQNLSPEQRQQRFQELGANAGAVFRRGFGNEQHGRSGGSAVGEVIAKDDTSITVKLQDGGSKIVFLSDSTRIIKLVEGALTDLTIGKNISITGSTNSDGSVTAQIIQLRPEW